MTLFNNLPIRNRDEAYAQQDASPVGEVNIGKILRTASTAMLVRLQYPWRDSKLLGLEGPERYCEVGAADKIFYLDSCDEIECQIDEYGFAA
ncbi:hypothetical protein VFPPC_13708 [Pochonia chlamydosporia 170]|uniref:Uncharacterized protein n=1 Tax=Pochonia chlamydosporia 170 TaxID=1380566 RepID=A0A179FSK7_METCM|nr:hypothetical protein VFPPC_13708 [Pochonia chlamydosporia 170]OAQ68605.1 hypothetical protein VFPPC_13708 [Pochonia chlamydosporia 170]